MIIYQLPIELAKNFLPNFNNFNITVTILLADLFFVSQLIRVVSLEFTLFVMNSCPLSCALAAPLISLVAVFLIGGIPFGYLAGRAKGFDIRSKGSGNIGATNVFRTMGKGWGTGVFIADFLKGFLPTLLSIAVPVFHGTLPMDGFTALVALAAVLGHSFTPYLNFKGGKGVATSAGVLLAMMPIPFAISAFAWYISSKISRYVSLSSMISAVVLPIATWYFHSPQVWYVIFSVVLGFLVIIRHKANIKRLINGTEPKIGESAK